MPDSTRRWPTAFGVIVSIVLVAAAVCLTAGVVTAFRFIVAGGTGGEDVRGALIGVLLYGPALIWAIWPITLPAIAGAGAVRAVAVHRYEIGRPDQVYGSFFRTGRVVLLAYASVLIVSWLVWLLGAR